MRQFVTALALTALALGACASPTARVQPTFAVGQATATGQLTVRITGWQPASGRSVQAVVADVERLDFTVSRQGGQEYRASLGRDDVVDGQASSVFTGLEAGQWEVGLEAFDARDKRIGLVSTPARVLSNQARTVELNLVLDPVAATPATGEVIVDGGILADNDATLEVLADLTSIGTADGLAPLPDGRVIVTGSLGSAIVDASGTVSPLLGVSGQCAAAPDGRVYIWGYNTVEVLDSRLPESDPGYLKTLINEHSRLNGTPVMDIAVAIGPDGRVYVGEPHRISVLNPDLPPTAPGLLTVLASSVNLDTLAVAADGTIYYHSGPSIPKLHRIDMRLAPSDPDFHRQVAGSDAHWSDLQRFYDGPGHLARFGDSVGPMRFDADGRLLLANQDIVRVLDHALPPEHPQYISKLQGPPGMPVLRMPSTIAAMAFDAAGHLYVATQSPWPSSSPKPQLLVFKRS